MATVVTGLVLLGLAMPMLSNAQAGGIGWAFLSGILTCLGVLLVAAGLAAEEQRRR